MLFRAAASCFAWWLSWSVSRRLQGRITIQGLAPVDLNARIFLKKHRLCAKPLKMCSALAAQWFRGLTCYCGKHQIKLMFWAEKKPLNFITKIQVYVVELVDSMLTAGMININSTKMHVLRCRSCRNGGFISMQKQNPHSTVSTLFVNQF